MIHAGRWAFHLVAILALVITPASVRAQTTALQWHEMCSGAVQKGDWAGVVASCSHEEVLLSDAMLHSNMSATQKEQLGEILVVAEVRLVAAYAHLGDITAARQEIKLARQTLQLTVVLGLDQGSPKYKELEGRIDTVAQAVGP
jgi:hypothetical protein